MEMGRDFSSLRIKIIINNHNVLDLSILKFSSKRNLTKEKRDIQNKDLSKMIFGYLAAIAGFISSIVTIISFIISD